MSDNQNGGSGDAFRRNQAGRKRREPPMIDATATEVSTSGAESNSNLELSDADLISGSDSLAAEEADRAPVSGSTDAKPTDEGADGIPGAEGLSPMPGPQNATDPLLAAEAADERPFRLEEPVGSTPETNDWPAQGGEAYGAEIAQAPPTAPGDPYGASEALKPATPEQSRSSLPLVLGLVIAVLVAALVGFLYAGPGSSDLTAQVDALTRRVAALEARPEPAKADVDVVALDKASKAVDADVGGLKTGLADLAAKLETVTRQASENADKIAALDKPVAPAPPPAPETPAPAAPDAAAPPPQATETPAVPETPPAAPSAAAPSAPPSAEVASAPPAADAAAIAALAGKVEDLAQRVAALPVATPTPPVDLAPLESQIADLAQRIGAEQAALAALPKVDPQAIDGRLGGLDRKLDATDHRLEAVSGSLAALPKIDLAPLADAISGIDKRLVPIEAALSAPKAGDRVTDVRAEGSAELSRAAPLAVVAEAVSNAIEDGRPFVSEIDALHGLGLDDAALGPLPGLAPKGAPTADLLRSQWAGVQPAVLTASGPKTGDSVLDRFAAGARNLVQVRQVGATTGDDPSAASARIGAALDRGDVAEALADWARLPDAGRAASQTWADTARGRIEAESTAQALLGRAIAALAKAKE